MQQTKRTYHPMLMVMYFAGTLDKRVLREISPTTIQYWKSLDHTEMYGYDLIQDTFNNYTRLEFSIRKLVIQQSIRICSRIIHTYKSVLTHDVYKKIYRKHAKTIIATIDTITPHITFKKACRVFEISEQQYYKWKNRIHCTASVLNLCFKVHPSQLQLQECQTIETAVTQSENVGKPWTTIFYNLVRIEKLSCSISTFYKYAHMYEAKRLFPKYKVKPPNNFRASQPYEYLHVDTTKVYTQLEGWLRVVFVKDNYSKSLLHYEIAPNAASLHIRDVLHHTFEKYDLYSVGMPIHIVSDDGTENKGEVTLWLGTKRNNHVMRVIAKKETDISNNMVETANHQFKNMFMKGKPIPQDSEELQQLLDAFYNYTNYEWMPGEFFGLTPSEVRNGEIPNRYLFTERIQQAIKERQIANKFVGLEICKGCKKIM
jgi:hypothetical protein